MPVLYLTEQGSTLRKEGGTFIVTKDGQAISKLPAIKVEQVVIFGNIGLTTPVIHYLLQSGIDCVFCSSYGKYHGRLFSTESKFGLLRRRQLEAASSPNQRLAIAREVVRGKITNQRTLLMRYNRESALPELEQALAALEQSLRRVERAELLDSLLAAEGYASAQYYRAFRLLLKQEMGFVTRVKRPPTDPVSSMLSFGYTLLVYAMQAAIRVVGLDPFIGFLHATEYSRPSLVLDLIEEFRAIIVDSVVLRLVNTHMLSEQHFERTADQPRTVLTQEGMKRFLTQFEERVQTQVVHPGTGTRATYRRIFELQARQLARVLTGQADTYQPFLVK